MRKSILVMILLVIIFVGSITGNLVLYGFWKQEKTAHHKTSEQLKQVKTTLRAAKENSPARLKSVAEDFARTLFSFEEGSRAGRKKRLLELSSRELGRQLFNKEKQRKASQ
jgi:uncharacterized protein HemX